MSDITAIIKDTIAKWGQGERPDGSPCDAAEQINHGNCDSFAWDVYEKLDAGGVLENHVVGHFWVMYEGKHYDAEHPLGVSDAEELWADW